MNNYIGKAPEMLIIIFGLICLSIWKKQYIYFIIAVLILCITLYFYRGATLPTIYNNTIISPADGNILEIINHGDVYQVIIFLNINNIHIQYSPINGKIVSTKYKKGEFNPAYLFKKSQYNERLETILDTEIGEVMVVQIAGLIARTIVPFKKIEDNLKAGEPIGLIKFGSRVDLWFPKSTTIKVKKGERIRIGDIVATY